MAEPFKVKSRCSDFEESSKANDSGSANGKHRNSEEVVRVRVCTRGFETEHDGTSRECFEALCPVLRTQAFTARQGEEQTAGDIW